MSVDCVAGGVGGAWNELKVWEVPDDAAAAGLGRHVDTPAAGHSGSLGLEEQGSGSTWSKFSSGVGG